jgi:hypothetical protein
LSQGDDHQGPSTDSLATFAVMSTVCLTDANGHQAVVRLIRLERENVLLHGHRKGILVLVRLDHGTPAILQLERTMVPIKHYFVSWGKRGEDGKPMHIAERVGVTHFGLIEGGENYPVDAMWPALVECYPQQLREASPSADGHS